MYLRISAGALQEGIRLIASAASPRWERGHYIGKLLLQVTTDPAKLTLKTMNGEFGMNATCVNLGLDTEAGEALVDIDKLATFLNIREAATELVLTLDKRTTTKTDSVIVPKPTVTIDVLVIEWKTKRKQSFAIKSDTFFLDGFPLRKVPDLEQGIANNLPSLFQSVAFAAAHDESRPVLSGVYVGVNGLDAQIVAADGFRLAYYKVTNVGLQDGDYIVPNQALAALCAALPKTTNTRVLSALSNNALHVQFTTGNWTVLFSASLVAGNFIDFARMLNPEPGCTFAIEQGELLKKLKFVSAMATASQGRIASFTIDEGMMEIFVRSDAGTMNTKLPVAELDSDDAVQFFLNVQLLAEGVRASPSNTIIVTLPRPKQSPALLFTDPDKKWKYLLMPMEERSL